MLRKSKYRRRGKEMRVIKNHKEKTIANKINMIEDKKMILV